MDQDGARTRLNSQSLSGGGAGKTRLHSLNRYPCSALASQSTQFTWILKWTPTVPQWRAWSTSRSFSNSAGGERFRKPSSAVPPSSSIRPAAGSEKSARTANNTTHSFTHKFHCSRSCVLSFFCRARPRLPVDAACHSAVPVPTLRRMATKNHVSPPLSIAVHNGASEQSATTNTSLRVIWSRS